MESATYLADHQPGRSADGLIGRDAELASLEDSVRALDSGVSGCVAIVGESGIGKTSLLRAALRRCAERDQQVLAGTAFESEQQVPFGPIVDALDRRLESLGEPSRTRLGSAEAAALGTIFPSLNRNDSTSKAGSQAERYRLHLAIRALLAELSDGRPLVLALDDVHWADEGSAELLAHLVDRQVDLPLLLIMSYRSRYLPRLLKRGLDLAASDNRLKLLELGPLSAAEADSLMGDELDLPTRRLLYEDSGGNPFYLEQLARHTLRRNGHRRHPPGAALALAERDPPTGEPGPEVLTDVPSAVVASLAEELARLSNGARSLLEAAAVAGDRFDLDLASEIAGLDEASAFEALDELVARELIRSAEGPRTFGFRHPIVQRAVYEFTGGGWRLGAHARVARALARDGFPAPARAYHVERSAGFGDEHALDILVDAAEATAATAPGTAARWYRAALRILPDPAQAYRRRELTLALAGSLAAAGQLPETRTALTEALELTPADATAERARIVLLQAQTEAFLGHSGAVRSLLTSAIYGCPESCPETVAMTLELAVEELRSFESDEAARLGREALEAARALGDGPVRYWAAAVMSIIDGQQGELSSARRHAAESREMLATLSNAELAKRLTGICFLALAEGALGQHRAAILHAERGLAICRATGQASLFPPLTLALGISKAWLGRLDDAAAEARNASEAAQLLRIQHWADWAAALQCWVEGRRGDAMAAVAAAERAAVLARSSPGGRWMVGALAHQALAEAWLVAGEPARCRRELLESAGGKELGAVAPNARPRLYCALVEAELRLGRPDDAAEWLRRADAAVDSVRLPELEAEVQMARAALELEGERPAKAVELALAAAHALDEAELAVDAGRARTLAGRALVAAGERERGTQQLQLALVELDALGALRARDEAGRELRRLGRRPSRFRRGQAAHSSRIGLLSPREREVAELVGDGHSNREIAARLVLSERTVESHLARIFRKLDLPSRAAVAREVARVSLPS